MFDLRGKSDGKPRIVIDGRMVSDVLHGIARYTKGLAKGLAELPSLPYEPVFLCAPGMGPLFSGFETVEMRVPFLDPTEIGLIPIQLWKKRAKLYHSPSFSSLAVAPCPWVVTIHDMNHLSYGRPLERAYYETILRSFADRAKRVITISEFSRAEIRKWNPRLMPEIVPPPVDPHFAKAASADPDPSFLKRHGLKPGRYFVCLSNEKPHKNVETLVRAFQAFHSSSAATRDYKLVLSTKKFAGENSVIALGGIPDPEAIALVRRARAVTFPSVYEGFGLPPVEGAVLGASVILSDIAPHREALRDFGAGEAKWVPALDEDAWMKALRDAAADSRNPAPPTDSTRQKLLERYSVRRMGESMDRIYRAVLGLD